MRLQLTIAEWRQKRPRHARLATPPAPPCGPTPPSHRWWRSATGGCGHRYATWFTNAGGQPLPDPVLAPGTDGDDTWVQQRVRRTHDVWHVVSGCSPSPAGEAALSAINVMQLRWPGSAMLLGADLLHRFLAGPAADEPDVGLTTAFGLQLGAVCAPLLAQRWEEGWHRPLAEWREQLGIAALVERSPFAAQ